MSPPPPPGRASALDALQTRDAILRAAAEMASTDGLETVTIGRLAEELSMSKSGVIGQFGTKEKLQVATLEHVFGIFSAKVWEPVRHLDAGLPRLLATCRAWARYAAAPGYTGGCCLAQITFDFDGRSGVVHDRLVQGLTDWRGVLRRDISTAVADGDLPETADPDQLAFGLEAIATGITPARLVHGNDDAAEWGLTMMHAVLGVDGRAELDTSRRGSTRR